MTTRWISVEHSLPLWNVPVLVHRARKEYLREIYPLDGIHIARLMDKVDTGEEKPYWSFHNGWRISLEEPREFRGVTHWMHLPTPPELDK